MAEAIQKALLGNGVLASLDCAQAYDRMAPKATVVALRALNFPETFVSLLEKAWTQKRWVAYQGHVHHSPLVAHQATPHGCPVAPMVLALWVSCGVRYVESQCQHSNLKHCVYMDDRSFTADSVEDIKDAIQSWMTWSQSVNLKESPAKTQVCSRNKSNQQQLLATWPQWPKTDVKVLGDTAAGRPRTDSPSEIQRLQAARAWARLLNCCACALGIRAFQAFVMAKATFSSVGRWPTKELRNLCLACSQGVGRWQRGRSVLEENVLRFGIFSACCSFDQDVGPAPPGHPKGA